MNLYFILVKEMISWKYSYWKDRSLNILKSSNPEIDKCSKEVITTLIMRRKNHRIQRKGNCKNSLILIDGTFYNIIFWFKVLSFLNVGSLSNAKVKILRGYHNRAITWKISKFFNCEVIDLLPVTISISAFKITVEYFQKLEKSQDIIETSYCGIPGQFIYDEVLRFQKSSTVQLSSEAFFSLYLIALYWIKSCKIVEVNKPKKILLSHIHTTHGLAICSAAFANNKTVFFMSGAFGGFRFTKLKCFDDFYKISGATTPTEFEKYSNKAKTSLQNAGKLYLENRFNGKLDDVGSRFAYGDLSFNSSHPDKDVICRYFSWDPKKPIICVYASKWFDTPHAYGMKNFIDFHDWISATIDRINNINDAQWLLKPHPCDSWYGGVTLKDIYKEKELGNVRYVAEHWSSKGIADSADAVVTVHGTCALEYAHLGKPVLCADQGWYDQFDFVQSSNSREDYLFQLANFWKKKQSVKNINNMHQFVGHFYSRLKKEKKYILPDDFYQDSAASKLISIIHHEKVNWEDDLRNLERWLTSPDENYREFKMRNSDDFIS